MNILVLNFFPAFYPTTSGGELRYYNLYNNLSTFHDITLLSPTYSGSELECIDHNARFREYRIPKENIFDMLHMEIDKLNICTEISALICALSAEYPNKYHEYYNLLYKKADIIIHESPYMLNYDINFGFDDKPRIYNSYNFETKLIEQMWCGEHSRQYIDFIYSLEKKLCEGSDLVFATCQEEKELFINEFNLCRNKVILAPNGVNKNEYVNDASLANKAFFIGSGHPPNLEAVEYIVNVLSNKTKEVEFHIAGSCCNWVKNKKLPSNVKLHGIVSDDEKRELFNTAGIAINPMFSGAGTNLKTLEFLSSGVPMISTQVGVRGIPLKDGVHFLLANLDDFSNKIRHLLADIDLQKNLSTNGGEFINTNFSWESIAARVNESILKIKKKNHRKTILLLNDFEVNNARSGGEVRIFHLYKYLSNKYNVILLCLNENNIIRMFNISSNFVQISIPKTEAHITEQGRINSKYFVSAGDIVSSYMVPENQLLSEIFDNLCTFSDLVILSHPYMANLIKADISIPVIHESHNHETPLKRVMLRNHPDFDFLYCKVSEIEKKALDLSKIIITVSDEENSLFKKQFMDKEIYTIKNGVDIKDRAYHDLDISSARQMFNGQHIVTFVGSAHLPNIEAVQFIINDLAPKMMNCDFCIIGDVCNALTNLRIPENVILFGRLEEHYKDMLLILSDAFVNPMLSGAGSSLKIADAFSKKIPIISTQIGARGYEVRDKKEIVISTLESFAFAVNDILNNKELREHVINNAYEYVCNNLSWQNLAYDFINILENKMFEAKQKKKLLIITYRFTVPSLGGAEVYMDNLLKELDASNDFDIDVCTFDVMNISNRYHFAANYTIDGTVTIPRELKNTGVYKFTTDYVEDTELLKNSKKIHSVWNREALELSNKFAKYYPFDMLLGGWSYPERHDGKTFIWATMNSCLFIKKPSEVKLSYFSPIKNMVKVYINEGYYNEFSLKNSSSFMVHTSRSDSIIRLEFKDEVQIDDARQISLFIKSILIDSNELDFENDYRIFLKTNYLNEYVDELIRNATGRDPNIDEVFYQTRGPMSKQLEIWLDNNISSYDVILGQGVPFSTSVITSKYARKHEKPFVILPHYHFDDDFYHWGLYYEAFKNADKVLVAPNVSKELFFNKISGNSVIVPGGGINLNEYQDHDNDSIYNLYKSNLPFILVLGRKNGAKNYKSIIEAIDKINEKEKICNLLMIGKDEDGDEIISKNVVYLKEQPRSIVLSALAKCKFLVNMSSSESFGIVIVESWASGKTVVVNGRCPAFTELVQDQINGLYATEYNLSEKIRYLLDTDDIVDVLSLNGQSQITNYTWKEIGVKIGSILLNLTLNKNNLS